MKIVKPTLLFNPEISVTNIIKIQKKLKNTKSQFRPHFKTHLSAQIGQYFKNLDINTCAVSSIDMAEYFSNHGWTDISIAFPVNILQIKKINSISKKCDLQLLVDSPETANFLDKNLQKDLQKIWIKLDLGYQRTGCKADQIKTIKKMIDIITQSSRLSFEGFMIHNGHSYNQKNKEQIIRIYHDSVKKSGQLKKDLKSAGFNQNFKISYGDTPSCSLIEDLSYMDEIRCGNFIFYDLMQHNLGSCTEDEIAMVMAAPVVAQYPDRNEVAIHCGAVHLSKEKIKDPSNNWTYGKIVLFKDNFWTKSLPDTYLAKVSQEHGIIKTSSEFLKHFNIGDVIGIIPVHSCLTVNLMKHYYTLQMKRIDTMPVTKDLN